MTAPKTPRFTPVGIAPPVELAEGLALAELAELEELVTFLDTLAATADVAEDKCDAAAALTEERAIDALVSTLVIAPTAGTVAVAWATESEANADVMDEEGAA
jgi:hypothetical protein